MKPGHIAIAVALTASIIPAQALAWGAEGHRIIAALAYERLTPKARKTVDQLIALAAKDTSSACPVSSIQDAATWADCVRGKHVQEFAYLTPDHFEDQPICGHEAKADYCRDGKCVTEETKRAIAVLHDPRRSAQDRLQALEEVVHFVGDMHQPLHVADNDDRGGNQVAVIFEGESTNLHAIWDTGLVIKALGRSQADAEDQLRPMIAANGSKWVKGSVDDWAAEAHQIAVTFVYRKLTVAPECNQQVGVQAVTPAYEAAAEPVVREQLARSAVRLAAVLNASF